MFLFFSCCQLLLWYPEKYEFEYVVWHYVVITTCIYLYGSIALFSLLQAVFHFSIIMEGMLLEPKAVIFTVSTCLSASVFCFILCAPPLLTSVLLQAALIVYLSTVPACLYLCWPSPWWVAGSAVFVLLFMPWWWLVVLLFWCVLPVHGFYQWFML